MSLYLPHPNIPAAKINAYPKRRKKQPDILLFSKEGDGALSVPHDVSYADFFVAQPAQVRDSA